MKTFQVVSSSNPSTSLAKRGFTLIEILIVLALIGLVAGLSIAGLSGIFGETEEDVAKTWVDNTGNQYILLYKKRNGKLPEKLDDLLIEHPRHGAIAKKKDLLDPWKNQYQYKKTGSSTFELWTVTPAPDNVKISSEDDE